MKLKIKVVVIIFNLLSIIVSIFFAINLLLNKKYAVDEISHTQNSEGLEGIQEIISIDYLSMFYVNIFFVVVLLISTVIFIGVKSNTSK